MFSARTAWQLAPTRFAEALKRHSTSGRPLLDLTASNPTTCGFACEPSLPAVLADPAACVYCPEPFGLLSAREAVAGYYAQSGAAVDPARIVLTTSTSEGYSWIFRLLCDPGDEVLAPAPSYPLFQFLADLNDVRLKSYPLVYDHGWQLDLHSVEKALSARTRAVMLVHPNNPTGSYVKQEELGVLNQLCAPREAALVADEVFLDFAHDGLPRSTFVSNAGALTFTLSGLSKIAGLPQMKVAWLAVSGPAELVEPALARLEIIADTYLSQNTPMQLALPRLLGVRSQFQEKLLQRMRGNLEELDRQLAARNDCRRLEVEGGWYAVLRLPVTRSDEELALDLLEKQDVLVHPGHFYDFPGEGYFALSLITPPEDLKQGVSRLLGTVADH